MSLLDPASLNPYIPKVKENPDIFTSLDDLFDFYRGHECIVELGCGNGHFLSEYLKLKRSYRGLGVDRRYKRIFKTQKKLEAVGAKTLRFDVNEFLSASPSNFWNEVWMQFPDPWPKKRHAKHRMVHEVFLHSVERVLKSSGRFCFVSDCKEYFVELQNLNQRFRLFPVSIALQGDLYQNLPSSIFKQIFMRNAEPIYSLELRK